MKRILTLTVATLVLGLPAMGSVASGQSPAPDLRVEQVPFAMDALNQAGWWHPLAEFNGNTYFAFNAPAAAANRHEVHIAKRTPSGEWTADCVKTTDGACVHYGDDLGHNQPSVAIDGDGFIHAFVSMHNDPWRYFRSEEPESVTTMVDRAADLPDQEGGVTYPVTATDPRSGDVYLMARVRMPDVRHTGHLYQWSADDQMWERVAAFTPGLDESGLVPYPDDLEVDNRGHVHLLWEWARGTTSNLRYDGSYLKYEPKRDRFLTISGREVDLPVTPDDDEVVYEPRQGPVQSARFALVHGTPRLGGIAYRHQPTPSSPFEVWWASWDGTEWTREPVDITGNTFAAIAATHHRATARIYYVRYPECDPDQVGKGTVHVAEKRVIAGSADVSGRWTTRLLGGAPGVERLAAMTRRDGTDVLYLAAPNRGHPKDDPALYFATLDRTPAGVSGGDEFEASGNATGQSDGDGRTNWALGAPVEVSSTFSDTTIGECAVDGNSWADYSRWMSATNDLEPWVTVELDEPIQVDEVHVFSGYQGSGFNTDFAVDIAVDGEWRQVASVAGNDQNPAVLTVDDLDHTEQLRLRFQGMARIHEIEVYARSDAPPLRITPPEDPAFVAFPGGSTLVEVAMTNRSAAPVSGTLEVDVPEGWTAEPAEVAYELDVNDTESAAFTVTSPPDVAPGEFEVVFRAPQHNVDEELDLSVRDGVILSDDGAPFYTETGTWRASNLQGYENSGSRYAPVGGGAGHGESATWTPPLPRAGTYRVYVWFPQHSSNTTEATYTVTHATGATEIVVNQRENGDTWHPLGTWEFEEGTAGSVTLTALPSASGYHRTNAVRFEPVDE